MRRKLILTLAFSALAAPAAAQEAEPGFSGFVQDVALLCARASSTVCVEETFAGLDKDRDGRLSPVETQAAHAGLAGWTQANYEQLSAIDRHGLSLTLQAIDLIGLSRIVWLYDTDGDGALTLDEATQDVRLDSRPLAELYDTGELVDWSRVRQRLGPSAVLLDYLGLG